MRTIIFTLLTIFSYSLGLQAQPYLYGTTRNGGLRDSGLLFVFNRATNQSIRLHDFSMVDGYSPLGSLLMSADGKLYGTTMNGGSFNAGVLFSYDPVNSVYSKEKEFTGLDGRLPSGSLAQDASGKIYGTTGVGNNNYNGTIYSFDPATKSFSNLYDFTGPEGAYPLGGLVIANNGKLYGTTLHDGLPDYGVLFCFDPVTKTYTKIHTFDGIDGLYSQSPLLLASDGKIYGVTPAGGTNNKGVIFSVDPANNTFSKLYDFTEGSSLNSGLLQASDGHLYGVTLNGGAYGGGIIYSFDPANKNFSWEYFFSGPEGYAPNSSLMQASDGSIYGTTTSGGGNNLGTIFMFDPTTKSVVKLKDFNGLNGRQPVAGLTESFTPPPIRTYVRLGRGFVSTAFTKEGQLVGIVSHGGFTNNIYRYKTDGTLDTSFGNGGIVEIDSTYIRGNDDPYDPYRLLDDTTNRLIQVAVDNSGRVIVTEHVLAAYGPWIPPQLKDDQRISRFTKEGIPDYSFYGNGRTYLGLIPGYEQSPGLIAVQKDTTIIAAYGQDYAARFISFTGGYAGDEAYHSSYYYPEFPYPVGTAFHKNGKKIFELKKVGPNSDSVMLIRLNSDGSFDPSFGSGGVVVHPFVVPGNISFYDAIKPEYWQLLAVQSNEKIIFVTTDNKLVRVKADGSLDSTFGNNGMIDPSITIGRILVGNDDKIYVGGSRHDDFALARYNANGVPDSSFGIAGIYVDDFGSTEGIQNMAIVGNTLYAYGNGILTSYSLYTCTPPTILNNNMIVLDASCGKNDGNASIIPTSGTPPFQYSIDGGATYKSGPDKGFTFENLAKGIYQLRLKDANGCESAIVTKEVKEVYNCPPICTAPTFLNSPTIVLDASCGKNDGNISIIPILGTAPFKYSIDGGTTYLNGPATGYTFENLAAGTYQLRLKDATGCESVIVTKQVKANAYGPCVTVKANSSSITMNDREGIARIFPNPSTGKFKVELGNVNTPIVQLTVLTAKGVVMQQTLINSRQSNSVEVDLSGKPKGIYIVRLVAETGSQVSNVIVQ